MLVALSASSLWVDDVNSEPSIRAGADRILYAVLSSSESTEAANASVVLTALAPDTESTASKPDDAATADAPAFTALVQQQLDQAQDDASQQTPEEQLAALKLFAAKLTSISSERSVDAISQRLNKVLEIPPALADLKPSAPAPASPEKAARLDIDSAQLIDVREETTNGRVRYFAVMEDAQKVREDIEVDAATGSQLVRTFALMKQFPLLESIYRKTVMGLLSKTLRQESGTAKEKGKPEP